RFISVCMTSWSWALRPAMEDKVVRTAGSMPPVPLGRAGAARATDACGPVPTPFVAKGVAERLTSPRTAVLLGCSPTKLPACPAVVEEGKPLTVRLLAAGAGRRAGLPVVDEGKRAAGVMSVTLTSSRYQKACI